ncbi:hypothetical protein C4D60_Mb06t13250 [Musa balbisiana]|uniref:Uncharacterized protein n=1 Tax=Musa balbisiana TaxID=52838 RepID=A0A4S8IMW1_MUSBA|nr:hypothetical protein C4D60_Mb06t13250 [Musa balbisiana]
MSPSMNLVGSDDDNDIVTEGSAFVHNEPAQHDKDLPKVESEMEVLHEKVKKQIIKEGHATEHELVRFNLGSQCTLCLDMPWLHF